MTSPICTVNGLVTTNGVAANSGSNVTFGLADSAGVSSWTVTCLNTDDLNTAASVNLTLNLTSSTYQGNFTMPTSAVGSAMIFQSKVNGGINLNGQVVDDYTTRFKVYNLTPAGVQPVAFGETTEGNAVYGYTKFVNDLLRIVPGTTTASSTTYGGIKLGGDLQGTNSTAISPRVGSITGNGSIVDFGIGGTNYFGVDGSSATVTQVGVSSRNLTVYSTGTLNLRGTDNISIQGTSMDVASDNGLTITAGTNIDVTAASGNVAIGSDGFTVTTQGATTLSGSNTLSLTHGAIDTNSPIIGKVNGASGYPLGGGYISYSVTEPNYTVPVARNIYRIHAIGGSMTGTNMVVQFPAPATVSGSYEHIVINNTNGGLFCRPAGGLTSVRVGPSSGSLLVFGPNFTFQIGKY